MIKLVGYCSCLANVFSPLSCINITGYLIVTLTNGIKLSTDRDSLILFNSLLVIICDITVFSITTRSYSNSAYLIDYSNIGLLFVTTIVNLMALSAIILRWSKFGITRNHVVVTGANIIIFFHLIIILRHYLQIKNLKMKGLRVDNSVVLNNAVS